MVADEAARPDVLPTDRLLDNGKARPELRADLRRIADGRNAVTVASVWLWVAVIIGGAVWVDRWWAYLVAFVLMGPMYARFAILMHEAAHKLLFTDKRVNDWVGTWLIAYPTWTPIGLYRRGHFAHHKEEFGPERARHRLLRRVPVRPPDPGPTAGARCRGHLGVEELHPAVPVPARSPPTGAPRCRSSASRCCCGRSMWAATGRWWIYPCCGGSRG